MLLPQALKLEGLSKSFMLGPLEKDLIYWGLYEGLLGV